MVRRRTVNKAGSDETVSTLNVDEASGVEMAGNDGEKPLSAGLTVVEPAPVAPSEAEGAKKKIGGIVENARRFAVGAALGWTVAAGAVGAVSALPVRDDRGISADNVKSREGGEKREYRKEIPPLTVQQIAELERVWDFNFYQDKAGNWVTGKRIVEYILTQDGDPRHERFLPMEIWTMKLDNNVPNLKQVQAATDVKDELRRVIDKRLPAIKYSENEFDGERSMFTFILDRFILPYFEAKLEADKDKSLLDDPSFKSEMEAVFITWSGGYPTYDHVTQGQFGKLLMKERFASKIHFKYLDKPQLEYGRTYRKYWNVDINYLDALEMLSLDSAISLQPIESIAGNGYIAVENCEFDTAFGGFLLKRIILDLGNNSVHLDELLSDRKKLDAFLKVWNYFTHDFTAYDRLPPFSRAVEVLAHEIGKRPDLAKNPDFIVLQRQLLSVARKGTIYE